MNYFLNKKTLFFISVTFIFLFINYFSINRKDILFLTAFLYLSFVIIYFILIYKSEIIIMISGLKLELKSISWPNKKEINQTAVIIIAIISATSLILWIIDSILTYIISKIFS